MIPSNRIWAIVPVKRFSAAKTRLACVLDAADRIELARRMFENVLDALIPCQDILAGTVVATSDAEVPALAHRRGAKVVLDSLNRGINAAVSQVFRCIHPNADDGLIILPSDNPQVTRNAFAQAAMAIATKPSLAIVAAVADGGTNLFACRPVDSIPPCFGPSSFELHRSTALQAGVAVRTLCSPELSLDIDRPEDLRTLLTLKSNTRMHPFLSRVPVIERIEEYQSCVGQQLDRATAGV